ncbi:MAG: hypothetical protein E7121_06855 [Bacteroidales bacterium]|nr:hypothetical protein [Bacteroidales bacterium]
MKKLLLSVMCLAAMWSCNTQDPENSKVDEGNIYMRLSLKMETKSGTDEDGDTNSNADPDYEVGSTSENNVNSVSIALVEKGGKGGYVTAKVTGDKLEEAVNPANTYIASFESQQLEPNATYYVYIYANCDAPAAFDADEVRDPATLNTMAAPNNFWMTNAYAANEVTLPSDLSPYTQAHSPFNLGAHSVERSVARFDFLSKNDNKFEILKENDVNATITLTSAAIINQSKNHYMFRRVSDDGSNNGWTVGGIETPRNYVVDTDYSAKANGYTENIKTNFNAHMTDPTNWSWIQLASLSQNDNWKGEGEKDHDPSDYKVMAYVKENTIPNIDEQEKGITTGVVFKGQITGNAIPTGEQKGMIFVFENVLYGNWEAVVTASQAPDAPATLINAVNKVQNAFGETAVTDPTDAATAKRFSDAGFTGYNPDADGNYYAYYYYWNRHNDNLDNARMGNMEFAVVRNNVYKLCVDKIAKFGHPDPKDPKNPDPDPEDPTDPDESLNYYFNVTVKVLPWVVRVNHIEF